MDWMSVWRHLAAAFILTVSHVDEGESDCPDSYWEEPSRRCSYPLASTLEQLQPSEVWNSDLLTNRTCTSWRHLSSCYHQLLRQCVSNGIAVQEIGMYLNRYRLFSITCSAGHTSWKDRQRLIGCFLPHIKPARICSEAFDSHFRNFVAEKQHRNACRVVSTAMKCFEEIRNEIAQSCDDDRAADDFQRSYIQPLVDQTRVTVMTKLKCELSAPYEQYFSGAAPPSERSSIHSLTSVVAFAFARWRCSL